MELSRDTEAENGQTSVEVKLPSTSSWQGGERKAVRVRYADWYVDWCGVQKKQQIPDYL